LPKTTAIAHAIQGLVKYHGLKERERRIPFHDSISVCVEQLTTRATIDFDGKYSEDMIEINGKPATELEAARVLAVVSPIRNLAKMKDHFKLSTANSLTQGKGLGFSASAFASISLASAIALGVKPDLERLSEIARLGAGSASRSLVGGFSIWYAKKNGRSYAKQLPASSAQKLAIAIVPINSQVKTEEAHKESVRSPFFRVRVRETKTTLRQMLRAIQKGDIDEIGRLAELESLSLHAVTMTGPEGLVLLAPETIHVIQQVRMMRETDHVPVWFSLDTGPSVYLNTHAEFVDALSRDIERNVNVKVLKSRVGGAAYRMTEHLF